MAFVGFTVEAGEVFFSHHATGRRRLDGADAATFEPLADPIVEGTDREAWRLVGRDRASVWFMGLRIPEADPASFRTFHGGQCHWAVDRAHVFALYVGAAPRAKVAASRATASFRFLDEPFGAYMRAYALTDERVYYFGRWVRGADPATFRRLAKDRFDDPPAWSDVYRDDAAAYFYGRRLEGVDPDALVVFHHPSLGSRVYAVDREHAYCVDTTRTRGQDVSGTPMTRLDLEAVRHEPRFAQVRAYLARRPDLVGYWFNP